MSGHLLKFFLIVFVFSSCSSVKNFEAGADKEVLTLEKLHGNLCGAYTCIRDIDSKLQKHQKSSGKRILQIYLIRHAKPDLKKRFLYSARESQEYIYLYNQVPIVAIDKSLIEVNLKERDTIYCSTLRRARETARGIFGGDYPIVADSLFREFEIKSFARQSIISLPLIFWKGLSRGFWLLGFNDKGIESYGQAKKRAKMCSRKLVGKAEQDQTSILVGHGFMNSRIEKELKRVGWTVVYDKGHTNLGATILVKEVEL